MFVRRLVAHGIAIGRITGELECRAAPQARLFG
jgi:hypothetical protein